MPGYHVSHPIARGHTDSTVLGLLEIATLNHAHPHVSVQSLLSTYTRGSAFFMSSALNWYTAEAKCGNGMR